MATIGGTRVYRDGNDMVLVLPDTTVVLINVENFSFDINKTTGDVKFTNTLTSATYKDKSINIREKSGLKVGSLGQIEFYLNLITTMGDMFNNDMLDADGSLPVSQKTILGNYVMDKHDLPYLLDRKGTGTQVWADGRVNMSVTSGQYAVCQSFQVHPYFAGKAQAIEITFDDFDIEVNTTKRVGLFDSTRTAPYTAGLDGFYLEMDGTTYNLVIKNSDAASTVTIPQASWDNQTDLPSLDLSKFNVMKIDFLYLGGTAVRLFFVVNGMFVLFHTYTHAGVVAGTIVSSPTLPVRWEIRSSTGTGSMGQICADVTTSGELALIGTQLTTPTSSDKVNANVAGTSYMLKAIRLSPTIGLSKSLLSISASSMSATNDDIFICVLINPTVAGALLVWNELQDEGGQNLGLQYADADIGTNPSTTTVTGGMLIWGGYMGNQTRELNAEGIGLNRKIGIDLDGNPDILVLCATPLPTGSNADLYGTLTGSIN